MSCLHSSCFLCFRYDLRIRYIPANFLEKFKEDRTSLFYLYQQVSGCLSVISNHTSFNWSHLHRVNSSNPDFSFKLMRLNSSNSFELQSRTWNYACGGIYRGALSQ